MSTITFTDSAPAGSWNADPVHSHVSFEIDYAGTNIFRGGFNDYAVTLSRTASSTAWPRSRASTSRTSS